MKSLILSLRGVLFVLVLSVLPQAAQAAARAQHVFIISLDGGKPAVIQKSPMPVLETMVNEGACTWTAQTIFPSITLPSHTSMLTGVGPAKHHILWNTYKPEAGVVQVSTVFSEAKQHGFSTAMFVGKEKFRHLVQPGMVDEFQFDQADSKVVTTRIVGDLIAVHSKTVPARIVARDAAAYIVQHRPNLCFIHFTDTDDTGHRYGWGSPQQVQAFADEDAALGVVFKALETAGILHDSVVIVTADHGGHARTHGSASPEDMNIPWVVWGKGVRRDYAIRAPVTTYDTAATALWLLDVPCPESWDGKPVASAFGPDTIGNVPLRSPVRQAAAN